MVNKQDIELISMKDKTQTKKKDGRTNHLVFVKCCRRNK